MKKLEALNKELKRMKIISFPWQDIENKNCSDCSISCQSACKTSCTVGNVKCEKRR